MEHSFIITQLAQRVLIEKIAELDGLTFIKLKDDKIAAMDEYWADDGEAPKWRQVMNIGVPIYKENPNNESN